MEILEYLKKCNIQKRIDKLAKKYKNKKVVIYGAGQFAKAIFENYDLSILNIIAIADRKFIGIQNESFYNIKAVEPEALIEIDYDVIIIANQDYRNIIRYLDQKSKNEKIPLEPLILPAKFSYIKRKKQEEELIREKIKNVNNKYIFTFWEPKSNLPAYLKLCMQTWKKFLPDYEIIVLDYSNLEDYLGKNYYDKILYEYFSLPMQADAIRCALLKKYGGIWLDTDTIITSDKIREFLEPHSEVFMFYPHIAGIIAQKNSKFMNHWEKNIKKKLFLYKLYKINPFLWETVFGIRKTVRFERWDYLGNSIMEPYITHIDRKYFTSLNHEDYYLLPEINYYKNLSKETGKIAYFSDKGYSDIKMYQDFYFSDEDHSNYVLENEHGMIYLHNSWTPKNFLNMNDEEFLTSNVTLTKILKKIL